MRFPTRLALILCTFMAGCVSNTGTVSSANVPAVAVKRIHNDYGGSIYAYRSRIESLPSDTLVRITGTCGSACTMYLGHETVCTTPFTQFQFHGPSDSGKPLYPTEFEFMSRLMASYYPEPLRSRFLTEYRFSIKATKKYSGRTLAELGVVTLC